VHAYGKEFEILHSIENDSRIAFTPRQISALPSLGEVDIMRSLQMYPGISVGRIGTAGLFIRGGTPDQNLITFDGMTLYHIDHFFGFFSAFNPNAVKDVQIYKGAFPVKYGGRISGIVELSGKNGDSNKKHISLSTGMLSTGMALELPLWRMGSVFLSARRSHVDYFKTPIYDMLSGYITGESYTGVANDVALGEKSRILPQPFKPQFYFYDLNGKITLMPSKRDVVSFSVYKGLDYFDQTTDEKSEFRLSGDSYSFNVNLHDRSSWGNFGTSFRWSRQWQPKLFSHLFIANSIYNSETFSKSATDTTYFNTLPIINLTEDNQVKDTSIRLESEWSLSAKHKAELGVGASFLQTKFSTSYAEKLWSVDQGNDVLLGNLYLQDQWTPNNKLQLTTGLRSNYFDRFNKLYYEPRIALRYLIDDDLALKTSFGQYYQFINRFINENTLDGANDFWLVVGDSIKPASSKNLILGIHNTNAKYSFGVEAYLKVIDNLTEYNRQQTILAEVTGNAIFENVPLFYTGRGYSQGFEISVQKKHGIITGWASYNFGKVEYTFPKINDGIPYLADHDRTHEFKCAGNYPIGPWNLSAAWVFSSGRVYTDVDHIEIQNWKEVYYDTMEARDIYFYVLKGKRNQYRLPPIHWLELAVSKIITIGKINGEVNLSIFNVYNQRSVSYRRYEFWKSPVTITDVSMIGFTPSINIKFNF
jgi:outer membrane cobalamin receptor